MTTRHVIVVNLGTTPSPEPEAVRAFLAEFLSDPMIVDYPRWLWRPILQRMILRSRPKRVAELYKSIWLEEGSPLAVGSRKIVKGLNTLAVGPFEARLAYRYGSPSIGEEIERAATLGVEHVVIVPLFPQRTESTTGTIERLATRRARKLNVLDHLSFLHQPPDDPGYIDALAARWSEALAESSPTPEHLVISFHGIPARYDQRERHHYREDCKRTTDAFLARIGWPPHRATLAYQSRFGPEPWIGPRTARVLQKLPKTGVLSVAVITPGFLTEGLETIEEIGIRGRQTFIGAGGEHFVRVRCVEDHPAFLRALAGAVLGEGKATNQSTGAPVAPNRLGTVAATD